MLWKIYSSWAVIDIILGILGLLWAKGYILNIHIGIALIIVGILEVSAAVYFGKRGE